MAKTEGVKTKVAKTRADVSDGGNYQIRVSGHIDTAWQNTFEGMVFLAEDDGNHATTLMTGPIRDQAALHGVLERIRDLNLRLLMVRRVQPE